MSNNPFVSLPKSAVRKFVKLLKSLPSKELGAGRAAFPVQKNGRQHTIFDGKKRAQFTTARYAAPAKSILR